MYKLKNRIGAGFTLIELLVVIAIIAILVILMLVAYNAARLRARDTERKSELRTVQNGLEIWNDTNNHYPIASYYISSQCHTIFNTTYCLNDYRNGMHIEGQYLPQDPFCQKDGKNCKPIPPPTPTPGNYGYGYDSTCTSTTCQNGDNYILACTLEADKDWMNYTIGNIDNLELNPQH